MISSQESLENAQLIQIESVRKATRLKVKSDEFKKLVTPAHHIHDVGEYGKYARKSMATWFRESQGLPMPFETNTKYIPRFHDYGGHIADVLEFGVVYESPPDWAFDKEGNSAYFLNLPVNYPEFGLSNWDMENAEVIGSLESADPYRYDVCAGCRAIVYTNLTNSIRCMHCEDEEND